MEMFKRQYNGRFSKLRVTVASARTSAGEA